MHKGAALPKSIHPGQAQSIAADNPEPLLHLKQAQIQRWAGIRFKAGRDFQGKLSSRVGRRSANRLSYICITLCDFWSEYS